MNLRLLRFLLLTSLGIGGFPAAVASPATQPGDLRADSTLHSIGFEWDLSGDTNHNATCAVRFRPEGETDWREALDLMRVDYAWFYDKQRAEKAANLFAGSILFLEPGTKYEIRLSLSDPNGGKEERTLEVATRPIPQRPSGGRTLHVVPGSGGGSGTKDDPFRGIATAQREAKPGDLFLLHKGEYGAATFDQPGEAGNYVVWKAAGDGEVILNQAAVTRSHLWIEGLSFQHEEPSPGLKAGGEVRDIVLRRNRFNGFHYSVLLHPTSRDWVITDNVIVGDNDPDQAVNAGGISGEGIELNHSGGHVVAWNDISRVADGVSYPERNVDIYGNNIHDVSDDGVETDRGFANVRVWGNRITNARNSALSFQPMKCGPWYFVRNLVIGSRNTFKFRVQDRFVLVNNTFVQWGSFMRTHHLLTALTRNNLFISADGSRPIWEAYDCGSKLHCLPDNYTPTWMTDVDYDGFDWGASQRAFRWNNKDFYPDIRFFAQVIGIEKHAVRVRKEEIFKSWPIPAEPGPVPESHLELNPGSNAVDAGAALPNLADQFNGAAPDLGAYEAGSPLPHYGPRS